MMKKYLENNTSLEDIKEAIRGIQKREDKRGLYIFIAIVTAILVATLIVVVYLLKNKMNDDDRLKFMKFTFGSKRAPAGGLSR